MPEDEQFVEETLQTLSGSIFRTTADQLRDTIAEGKTYIVERSKKDDFAFLEVVAEAGLERGTTASRKDQALRVEDYTPSEVAALVKNALLRMFVEPRDFVDPIKKTLLGDNRSGEHSRLLIAFADPSTPDKRTTLDEYEKVLSSQPSQALARAIKEVPRA